MASSTSIDRRHSGQTNVWVRGVVMDARTTRTLMKDGSDSRGFGIRSTDGAGRSPAAQSISVESSFRCAAAMCSENVERSMPSESATSPALAPFGWSK